MFNKTSLALALLLGSATASATTISYGDFSSTAGLQLNNSAASATDDNGRSVLRVTPSAYNKAGSAFSTDAITLAADASFSTKFSFNFNHQLAGGADGLVFVVQTVSNTAGGGGGGIGYAGLSNSVGIEFDNYNNGAGDGYSANHVGIDINGNVNSVALNTSLSVILDSSTDLFAWIDYNGVTDLLEVRLSSTDARPDDALLSYVVDLASVLGSTDAYVGFTSGTGGAAANHDVISWEFRDAYDPVTDVPEPLSIALSGLGLTVLAASRRRRR